jgi:hypothetical protein
MTNPYAVCSGRSFFDDRPFSVGLQSGSVFPRSLMLNGVAIVGPFGGTVLSHLVSNGLRLRAANLMTVAQNYIHGD